ncbi:two-component sensor histidine kinase [Paracoccus limosus]|uniref:histidine kinase n=1 Tax=Paracoccus limosus TaxID=913252 RepID=A0A844H7M0_9RHOB|nr:ATP-binding protein [Paracoccus limosus]MTH36065.1 two-component sensor histidine kinase [Paracoccus limosus]
MAGGRPTLVRRLALLVSLGLGVLWLVAVLTMAMVLRQEQDELYDQQLKVSAETLLPILSHGWRAGLLVPGAVADSAEEFDPGETLLWRLVDRDGGALAMAPFATAEVFPPRARPLDYGRTATHVVYMTDYNDAGLAVQFADPLAERREAWRETFMAFLFPMLAILPLGYMLVRWITAKGLQPLDEVRAELAQRDSQSLSPMDASARPAELSAIIATLNGFMARLSQALEGERAFASNAAHELRTPVAVALAQVQRMQREVAYSAQGEAEMAQGARLAAIEQALKRMSRLVARLLQLARAQSGLGPGAAPIEVGALLPHILRDSRGGGAGVRLDLPRDPVSSRIDADALAIVLGNLLDNALQHAPEGTPVDVSLSPAGVVLVRNAGPAVPPAELARLADRFASRRRGGFGLGLHIAQQITQQAGGRLELTSPAPGRADGFEAALHLP